MKGGNHILTLFNKYKNSGLISETLLTGHNLFNKNSDNLEIFESYFDFLCCLANDTVKAISERQKYLNQAEITLAFFSENANLDEQLVELIKLKEKHLYDISVSINKKAEENNKQFLAQKIKANDEAITLLKKLIKKLGNVGSQSEFDKIVNQIGKIDATIENDYLVDRQKDEYEQLTKQCNGVIDFKMKDFEKKSNTEYNIRAIEAYERVFKLFKEGDVPINHMDIIKELFIYDASRLLNETLVYYNHVYSYVLSKLDDDGKLMLTKYAIMCEKIGR